MVIATGSYLINDTLMKLATAGLPPYEVLFLRGVAATLWGVPLLLGMGYGKQAALVVSPPVLLRNIFELLAILLYMLALTNMPIADATALGQVTPLLMIIGASILFREKVGGLRMALIGVGFIGALMVAQPTMQGISPYALLALGNAIFCAARDIAGRRIPPAVPGLVVAISAVLLVLVGAGAVHLLTEQWVIPSWQHVLLIGGAGLFLVGGHFFIFMSYRVGQTAMVAPFYYFFTFWAVISGLVVFGQFPNSLAIAGIVLVVVSGVAVVLLGERQRRMVPVA